MFSYKTRQIYIIILIIKGVVLVIIYKVWAFDILRLFIY